MTSIAYAMAQGGGTAQGGSGGFASFVPLILMFVIFYFLLIRPQQKKAKEHQRMIGDLRKGDRIITNGGLYGRITGLDENTLTVEIADRVRVKVARANVAALASTAAPPKKEQSQKKAKT